MKKIYFILFALSFTFFVSCGESSNREYVRNAIDKTISEELGNYKTYYLLDGVVYELEYCDTTCVSTITDIISQRFGESVEIKRDIDNDGNIEIISSWDNSSHLVCTTTYQGLKKTKLLKSVRFSMD